MKPCIYRSTDGECGVFASPNSNQKSIYCFLDSSYKEGSNIHPLDICGFYEDGYNETELPEDFGMDY